MTKTELENKVEGLSQKFDEMMGSFRNLFSKTDQSLDFIREVKRELEGVKVDVANLKSSNPAAQYNSSTRNR